MIIDVGREIQWEKRTPEASVDFGLELVAGASGIVLRKGSIQASIALTQNTAVGMLAVQEVVRTLDLLQTEELAGIDPR